MQQHFAYPDFKVFAKLLQPEDFVVFVMIQKFFPPP